MANEFVLVEKSNRHIVSITLNRPEKRNAFNAVLIAELLQAIQSIAADASVRVVIIHGNGDNFCAGGDIQWMQDMAKASAVDNVKDSQMLADLLYQLYHLPMPTITLAHGAVLGGGLGLLAASDIVIAGKHSSFGFSEVKIGLAPSTISPYVIAAIGERAAHYYFLTGERFQAAEAQRIGLVHHLTEEDALLRTGAAFAERLLSNSKTAMRETKSLIRQVAREKISPQLSKFTAEHLAKLRTSPEAQEGLKAFLEKRDPNWR